MNRQILLGVMPVIRWSNTPADADDQLRWYGKNQLILSAFLKSKEKERVKVLLEHISLQFNTNQLTRLNGSSSSMASISDVELTCDEMLTYRCQRYTVKIPSKILYSRSKIITGRHPELYFRK
ncbi:hypothetical protein CHS0354_026557 [Potamilus streckersoni]|uniref:Uncharacterized protein n=1 Tax=Potamilus streckersoni TaxID=2493646 RepID=A0AAE0VGN6_9BIVA|nr:hypothetical protein CHS0354_026557 [Potamilus streckersoni]